MARSVITINSKDLDKLTKAIEKSPKVTLRLLSQGIAASGAVLAKHTLKNNPVPYKTGFLLASFRYQQMSALVGRWFPTVHYAVYVDQGTSRIAPRRYMDKIADKSRKDINRLFNSLAIKIAKEIIKPL